MFFIPIVLLACWKTSREADRYLDRCAEFRAFYDNLIYRVEGRRKMWYEDDETFSPWMTKVPGLDELYTQGRPLKLETWLNYAEIFALNPHCFDNDIFRKF